jgi:hypothetical protein
MPGFKLRGSLLGLAPLRVEAARFSNNFYLAKLVARFAKYECIIVQRF